jgi:Tfp pilus assembly protein PilO
MNSRREQTLTLLVVGALTVIFVLVVALPGSRARAELQAEIDASQAEIARGAEILNAFRGERHRFRERQEYLAASAGTVGGSSDLLQEISRIASATGFRVIRIEPEQSRVHATYVELPFRLDFKAKLGTLAGFLGELEANERYFAIEELSMRNQADQEGAEELEGKLRFVVYAATDSSAAPDEENDSKG